VSPPQSQTSTVRLAAARVSRRAIIWPWSPEPPWFPEAVTALAASSQTRDATVPEVSPPRPQPRTTVACGLVVVPAASSPSAAPSRSFVWHLLSDPDTHFHDLGPDYYDSHTDIERRKRNHLRQLQALGYTVTLQPAA
jgi:hypothetical protein